MSSETVHAPASERQSLDVVSGTSKIAGILNREAPDEGPDDAPVSDEASFDDAPVEEREEEPPVETEVEARDEPKDETPKEEPESEVTSEIELEPAQLARLLGLEENDIEVDDDGAVKVHAKIDGKPATVPLSDLRHSYQLAQTHEERLRQLGRERKEFEETSRSVLDGLMNQHQAFAQGVQALEEEFANDFQSVDWPTLRSEDPTEYNAKRLDYEDRRKRIEEYKAKARNQAQQLQAQQVQTLRQRQTEGAKALEDAFTGELYKSAPKWDEAERKKLGEWIMEQGFSANDIANVGVWQVFKWARDSMLREQELRQARESVKKVSKVAKIVKPGSKKGPQHAKKAQVKELKARQRKSGGDLRSTETLIRGIMNDTR